MIPKVIHYCWFGGNALDKKIKKCIKSWKKYCPDYEIIEWNESNYDINASIEYVKQAIANKQWAFATDYIRLDLIDKYGGIYMDTDVEIIKNLDKFLDCEAFFCRENDTYIATGLGFGAVKGSSIIRAMKRDYESMTEWSDNKVTCPVLNSKHIFQMGFSEETKQIESIDGINVYPSEYFCPINYITMERNLTDNTHSIHHYYASWMTDDEIAHIKSYGKSIKRNRRKDKVDRIIHTPNRVLIKIMGNERYERIKKILKK